MLQARDELWKATGNQLIAEEEQAAAKAAAKQAKKLRQKANRQRAQQALQAADDSSAQPNFDTNSSAATAVVSQSLQHTSPGPAEALEATGVSSPHHIPDIDSPAAHEVTHDSRLHSTAQAIGAGQATAHDSSLQQQLKPDGMAPYPVSSDSLQRPMPTPDHDTDPEASANSSTHPLPQHSSLDATDALSDTLHRTDLLPVETKALTAQVKAVDTDCSLEATQHPAMELKSGHDPAAVQGDMERWFCCPITQVRRSPPIGTLP